MRRLKDLSGQRFGRWLVVDRGNNRYQPSGGYRVTWNCICDCGNKKEVPGSDLVNGFSKSCGCYMIEKAISDGTTHGLSKTKEFGRWCDMHDRCYNEKNPRYKDWGGRGIKICPRWNKINYDGFVNFYNDIKFLGSRPYPTATINRINNDGDYAPDNIEWSSKREQRLNQRSYRVKFLTFSDKTLCMKDWAQILHIHSSNILYWLKKGKDFEWIYAYYMEFNNVKSRV